MNFSYGDAFSYSAAAMFGGLAFLLTMPAKNPEAPNAYFAPPPPSDSPCDFPRATIVITSALTGYGIGRGIEYLLSRVLSVASKILR